MSSDSRTSGWFTEQQAAVALMLTIMVLAGLVVLPYAQYVLFGMVLAYIIWPLQELLARHTRRDISALVLTAATVVAIPVPFVYILIVLSRQALSLLETIEEGDFDLASVEASLLDRGVEVDLGSFLEENQDLISDAFELVVRAVLDTAQSLPNIAIGLTITVFVLFVTLRDGGSLASWVRRMVPVRETIQKDFEKRLDRLMMASVVGNVAAGAIQAVALGFGFFVLGFDNVLFLTVLTFIMALLPLVGAFVVWIPVVLYLAAMGQVTTAATLALIGTVVSVSDFYTRPMIIGHSAALNVAVIVVGVFGGLVAFGPIGLLIGPVLVGAAKIAIEATVGARNQDRNRS